MERNVGFLSLGRVASPQAAGGGLEMLCPGAAVHLTSAEGCPLCHALLQAVGEEADVTAAAMLPAGFIFPACIFFYMYF